MKVICPPPKPYNLSFYIQPYSIKEDEEFNNIRITVLKCNSDPAISKLLCSFREYILLDKQYLIDKDGLIIDLDIELEEGFYCIQGYINIERSFNKIYYVPKGVKQLIVGYKYSIYETIQL